MSLELSIIIPAYNESTRLPSTLLNIQQFIAETKIAAEVIVVDDGSQDNMCDVVHEIQANFPELKLISYPHNQGKGYATKIGMLSGQGDFVLYMDADNSTNIREYLKFKPLLELNDIVIASRYLPTSEVDFPDSWHRVAISRTSHILIKLMLNLPFRDTQCGFKVFHQDIVRSVFERQSIHRFGFDMELLVIARKLKLKVAEAPVRWIDNAESKVRPVQDTLRTLQELLRIRANLSAGKYN